MKCFVIVVACFGALVNLAEAQTREGGLPRFKELFEKSDQNGNGKLSVAEAEKAGRKAGWIPQADQDKDGEATWEEALAFLKGRMEKVPDEQGEPLVFDSPIPEDAPFGREGVRAAARYSARQNGHGFLVMWNGQVLFERYDRGWTPDRGHRLASGTKSFSGALLAAGVKDELLTLDEPVSDTISEWKKDELLALVTIRELLSLTSGIDPGDNGKVPAYADVGSIRPVSPAGEKFRYGPNAFQVFGELMRRKLKARKDLEFDDPLAYLEARVFDPIGMSYSLWRKDSNGMPHLPSGAFLTIREWVKFGEFLRNEGSWKGEALVDARTLQECRKGSAVNAGYGLTFWLLDDGTKKGSPAWMEGAYMAAGAGKQRLYILPKVGVVVARQGESRKFENSEFLGSLFGAEKG